MQWLQLVNNLMLIGWVIAGLRWQRRVHKTELALIDAKVRESILRAILRHRGVEVLISYDDPPTSTAKAVKAHVKRIRNATTPADLFGRDQ